jgi:hypothetical protein
MFASALHPLGWHDPGPGIEIDLAPFGPEDFTGPGFSQNEEFQGPGGRAGSCPEVSHEAWQVGIAQRSMMLDRRHGAARQGLADDLPGRRIVAGALTANLGPIEDGFDAPSDPRSGH